MTRQLEPLNHELGRLNMPPDLSSIQKEIGYVVSLFQYKHIQLRAIGDQFIQHVRQKDPTTICLYLIALYEELNAIVHVAQRLLVCYLVYRLKDVWKNDSVDRNGMLSHPYLIVFVKIYWNYVSPRGSNPKDRSLLHFIGEFPKITAQEAYFVELILTSPTYILRKLFERSAMMIASDPVGSDQTINIDPLKTLVEHQLQQFPFFDTVLQSSPQPRQAFNSNASLQRIVLSLVSPHVASLNSNTITSKHSNNRTTISNQPASRRTLINSSYGYFSNSATPQGVARPLSTDLSGMNPPVSNSATSTASLPPVLAKLFNTNAIPTLSNSPKKSLSRLTSFFNQKSNSNEEDIDKLNTTTFGDGTDLMIPNPISSSTTPGMTSMFFSSDMPSQDPLARLAPSRLDPSMSRSYNLSYVPNVKVPLPDPIGTPLSASRKNTSPVSVQFDKIADEAAENRKFAFEMMDEVVKGNGNSLGKSQITKLLGVLGTDKEILPMIDISPREFELVVDSQPDLAAEVLVQSHSSNSQKLHKLFEVILGMELSVHSLVAVSRFISSCERSTLSIPDEFLNGYITHCIQACERVNAHQLSNQHRLVRMVCVFFSTLIRLNSFNVRPRITEMRNFATDFSSVKETNQLYQAIAQMR